MWGVPWVCDWRGRCRNCTRELENTFRKQCVWRRDKHACSKKAGDLETAERRKQGLIRAGARFGVLGLSVAAAVTTGGIAASYGVVVSAVAGAVVGGGIGAASTAATQIIDNGEVDLGAVIGNGLFGGALIAGNSLDVVTSNVWANNAAGTYPGGPNGTS